MTPDPDELFEKFWAEVRAANNGHGIGADYRHWARVGWLGGVISQAPSVALLDELAALVRRLSVALRKCQRSAYAEDSLPSDAFDFLLRHGLQ